MLKKVVFGIILIGLSTVLVVGAINRTSDLSERSEASTERSRGAEGGERNKSAEEGSQGNQYGRSNARDEKVTIEEVSSISQGNGNGGSGGRGNNSRDVVGGEVGTDQTEAQEWITVEGYVGLISEDALTVVLSDGEEILVEGRAWRFAQENEFSTEIGHRFSITGFYEDGEFKAGLIVDLTTDLSITLRQESGRPSWARWSGGRA